MREKIKVGFISDLHSRQNEWKDNLVYGHWGYEYEQSWKDLDLLIFAGDCSNNGTADEIDSFLHWFNLQPAKEKVMIGGNHDFFFDPNYTSMTDFGQKRHGFRAGDQESIDKMLAKYPKIHYLNDSSVELYGLKIWGSPVSPWFHDWAYNRVRCNGQNDVFNGIKQHWDKTPNDIDIMVTHTPPYGQGDLLSESHQREGEDPKAGCVDLMDAIERIKPMVNVFGHIHEAYGITENEHTKFINASCLTVRYKPNNPPIIMDL